MCDMPATPKITKQICSNLSSLQKRVDFASAKNLCQAKGMSLLSPPGTSGMISTSVYERILLRLQTVGRSKRKRTMAWIELVRSPTLLRVKYQCEN